MSRTTKKAAAEGAHRPPQHHEAPAPVEHPVAKVHAPQRAHRPASVEHKMPRSYSYRTSPRQG